jgi:hypothetical protein
MTSETAARDADSPNLLARLAGVAWLVAIVCGLFAELYVRSSTIVHGDAAATAARITAAEPLYRLGVAADLVGIVASLVFTLLLYPLLRPVSRNLSMTAAGFGLAGCAVAGANLLNFFAPLVLIGLGPSASGHAVTDPWILVFLRLYSTGYNISIVFFAFQVAMIGRLILGSTFLPKFLGILFLVEGACNLTHSLLVILYPAALARFDLLLISGLFAEGGMTLWLLLRGVNVPAWRAQARGEAAAAA